MSFTEQQEEIMAIAREMGTPFTIADLVEKSQQRGIYPMKDAQVRNKVYSLTKFDFIREVGYRKVYRPNVSSCQPKLYMLTENAPKEDNMTRYYVLTDEDKLIANTYRQLCQKMVNKGFYPDNLVTVYDFYTDDKVSLLQYDKCEDKWYYLADKNYYVRGVEYGPVTVPEVEMTIIVPMTRSAEGGLIPAHPYTIKVPSHETVCSVETTEVDSREEWILVKKSQGLKPNTPENKCDCYHPTDIRN